MCFFFGSTFIQSSTVHTACVSILNETCTFIWFTLELFCILRSFSFPGLIGRMVISFDRHANTHWQILHAHTSTHIYT